MITFLGDLLTTSTEEVTELDVVGELLSLGQPVTASYRYVNGEREGWDIRTIPYLNQGKSVRSGERLSLLIPSREDDKLEFTRYQTYYADYLGLIPRKEAM